MAGAPKGNTNARRGTLVRNAIMRALKQRTLAEQQSVLRQIQDKVIDEALEGKPWAVQYLAERIDGKAMEHVTVDTTVHYEELSARTLAGTLRPLATPESPKPTVQ